MKRKIFLFIFLFTLIFIPKIYASCDEGSYMVTYNANGGSGAADPTCATNYLSSIKPSRRGYKFLGWSTNKKNLTAMYKAGGYIELSKDITLYAIWSKGYKITYNPKGGTISATTKTVYPGLSYGTLLTPKRKGFKFLGWYTDATKGELVTNKTLVTNKKTHTLYARYQKIKYTITYELNSGINNEINKTSYYVTTGTFKLANPTRKGYKFLGWYKESNFKTKVTYIYKGTTGNKTFYARWTPIQYSISFYGNGSTSGSVKSQTGLKYNKVYVLNTNKFKKTDYVFDSWNTKSDGTGKTYANEARVKNLTAGNGKTVKLYAMWKRREYKITYVLNGGTNPSDAIYSYTKVSNITLKNPTREGYTFLGWYKESNFVNRVTKIEKGTTGNKTFYAKWKFDAYLITYVLNGGVNPINAATSYKYDEEVELPTPARVGYEFKGWYTDSALTHKINKIESGSTGNKTLYAKWEKIQYSITYVLDGGVNPNNSPSSYTVTDEVILPTPTKEELLFLGWYTEDTFTNEVVKIEKGTTGNKTLYAQWDVYELYNINYVLNGGINPLGTPVSYNKSQEVVLPTPTREGYTFDGWYTESTFVNRVTRIAKRSSGDKTFYAKWTTISYPITYVLNGGTIANNSANSYTIESGLTLPTPTREGYTFEGWYTESTFNNKVTKINTGSTGEKTFYAKWMKITYSIVYETYGGSLPSNAPSSYTVEDNVVLPTPTREGYTFEGWYTSSTFNVKVESYPVGTTGNKNLYAKWTPITYAINYVLNGGVNSNSNPSTYTIEQSVSFVAPTREGYTFEGWYTDSFYTTQVTAISIGSTGSMTLCAKWTITNYTITYNLNGGVLPSNAPTQYTINSSVALPTPTREGYTFAGWYTDSSFTNRLLSIPSGSTGNKVLYAKWTLVYYNINYNLNGGTNPSGYPANYNITQTITLPTPTKSGYLFSGWYTESTFVNRVTTIPSGSTGTKTYYAKWDEPESYTIDYVLDGGTLSSSAPRTYNQFQSVTLPTPSKTGYAFVGWYTESTFVNKVTTIPLGTTGNKIFYAKWTIVYYQISFNSNGGTLNGAPTTYNITQTITLPTPTREGYGFDGWYTEENFVNRVTSIEAGSTGNKTFYAKWHAYTYFINYILDGGTLPSSAPTAYTINDSVTLPMPSKDGYAFVGWFTDEKYNDQIYTIPVGTSQDTTVYAKWTTIGTYSIAYHLNGGTNPSGTVTSYNSNSFVILPTPTKTGYGFDGWYTEEEFINRVETIPRGSGGVKHFYAKWGTIYTYNINYNLNGGTNPSDAQTTYNNYEEVTLPTPMKSGYTFEGWYTDSSFTNMMTTISSGTTGDLTLYAKWTSNTLKRNYDYELYNNDYDNQLTSFDDIKNTFYNIFNDGLVQFTAYCNYSVLDDCITDFTSIFHNQDLMKSISDYVNPYYSFSTLNASRTNTGKIIITVEYNYNSSKMAAIDSKIDQVISSLNLSSKTTDDKIRAIHDYIIKNGEYDYDAAADPENSIYEDSFTAYGTLINGLSVCQGYADSMALFLDRYKIPNIKVSSDSHTWNLIYVDGSWWHLDATWDDLGVVNGQNLVTHTYYLLTTQELHNTDATSAHTYNYANYLEAN